MIMEEKISVSTITLCLGILEGKRERMQDSINFYDNPEDVPTWMYDSICDYKSAIDELKKYVDL